MKKFNKDDFKKFRDKYPFTQRFVLAVIIASIIGLTVANSSALFSAPTNNAPYQITIQTKKIPSLH
ncbi:hypothetical protein [Companilactobacillus sp.]|jgi:hypothetical protein|uniref:hypothetical protein n=1 Tax=Companilactobacillus sp. TaxID=2767905 RepID=UPI0025BBE662|nr:hypothetical protein [Companilactobacillus sp.]MCH4008939.1 hypothetical protein [Companilactobacillus sp.]MCH4050882.1 hypothetical protein [Companilactobacillus sp.]MCH4076882.1 hypothetical protein [Companilactobacillus sp.]MCH4125457.1 hypothetical protein [Companilactobacillus sp.]MCH4131999.1 hypothetical protein [Companilactobacillus sp.]